jgi:hypothetical protein
MEKSRNLQSSNDQFQNLSSNKKNNDFLRVAHIRSPSLFSAILELYRKEKGAIFYNVFGSVKFQIFQKVIFQKGIKKIFLAEKNKEM